MHCPSLQVNSPSLQPVSFNTLVYGFPLLLHSTLSFSINHSWVPKANEANEASVTAIVFCECSVSFHAMFLLSYSMRVVSSPSSWTAPDFFLFLGMNTLSMFESEHKPLSWRYICLGCSHAQEITCALGI